jgi:pimeloyl-ACP methyl ester carboxylesterase
MFYEEIGSGRPLVMIHGLGGSARSWDRVSPALAEKRRLILLDLPGHGRSQSGSAADTFEAITNSVEEFLVQQKLIAVDVVGSSLGGRIVLELARRGSVGSAVALDPGGFWQGWERSFVRASLMGTIKLIRALGQSRQLLASSIARPLALRQLSHRPSALPVGFCKTEIDSCSKVANFEAIVRDLTSIPAQAGPAAPSVSRGRARMGQAGSALLPEPGSSSQCRIPRR